MFEGATSFKQDIGNWDVSSGIDFSNMFEGATSFNHDLSSWNVSIGTDFSSMFSGATSFNADISGWPIVNYSDLNLNDMFKESLVHTTQGMPVTPSFENFNQKRKFLRLANNVYAVGFQQALMNNVNNQMNGMKQEIERLGKQKFSLDIQFWRASYDVDGDDNCNIYDITVSPDGNNVYAVSSDSNCIIYWNRVTQSVQTAAARYDIVWGNFFTKRNSDGVDAPYQVNSIDTTNLNGASSVTVSPDNKNVYAVASKSNSIVYWNRNTDTAGTIRPGALTNQVNLFDSHIERRRIIKDTDAGGLSNSINQTLDSAYEFIKIGMRVTNANIPAGTTVTGINGTSLTLSAKATAITGTQQLIFDTQTARCFAVSQDDNGRHVYTSPTTAAIAIHTIS